IDVLILLGRVLRVLDGAVRAVHEPLRVLLDVRVIGRGLEGDVERHLEPMAASRLQEVMEIVEGAELRMNGAVAALGRADRPRAARIAGRRRELVVAALAKGAPDGMDRRQV